MAGYRLLKSKTNFFFPFLSPSLDSVFFQFQERYCHILAREVHCSSNGNPPSLANPRGRSASPILCSNDWLWLDQIELHFLSLSQSLFSVEFSFAHLRYLKTVLDYHSSSLLLESNSWKAELAAEHTVHKPVPHSKGLFISTLNSAELGKPYYIIEDEWIKPGTHAILEG